MVEGGLHPGADAAAAPAAAPPAAATAARGAVALLAGTLVGGPVLLLRFGLGLLRALGRLGLFGLGRLCLGRLGLGGGLLLLERGGLDLGLDLVAEVDLRRVLVLDVQFVLAAELAQLVGRDLELVRDPGVGPPLAHPGADLVQL